MADKPKATHVLGIEWAGDEVHGAKLSQKRGKPSLDNLFSLHVPPMEEGNVKPLYIPSTGKTFREAAKRYLLAAALPGADVLTRALDVSLKKAGDIDAVLPFQSEPILPYPAEDAILDRIILSQSKEGTRLTVLAAKKERVNTFIDSWTPLGIEPEAVTAAPAALAAFSDLVAPREDPFFIVHLGKTQTVCALVHKGKLIGSQTCSKHMDSLEKALAADVQDESEESRQGAFHTIPWDNINGYPTLKEALELLEKELARTLFSLGKLNKGEDVHDILITGDCGAYYDLLFHLAHVLGKNVVTPEIPPTFNAPLPQVLKFAVPIGAALTYLPASVHPINFRQQEFVYPDPWKRLKQPLTIYFGLCVAVAAALYVFGMSYLGYQEDRVRAEYSDLLMVLQKPHTPFEETLGGEGTVSLQDLSMEQLGERVALLEKELDSAPEFFPLLPNVMTVGDVFAWLNSQSTVVEKDPKTGKTKPLIQIDALSYSMVKRPEINKKNEKYQVKVEVEFSTPTPKEAREFHDALIAPNDLVDPKGEVKWSTTKGKYRASFYLKDKTAYPANN